MKQVDPLSPLHFVLTMEYFTRLMKQLSTRAEFKFHQYYKGLKLNHLMFADDVVIFCKAHPPTLQLIKQTLKKFHVATGLEASATKSHIIFRGCCTALKSACLQETGFQEGTLPMTYLGIPIIASRLSKMECIHWWKRLWGK